MILQVTGIEADSGVQTDRAIKGNGIQKAPFSASLNQYHNDYLNPYINFHRPCFFPVSVIDHRGRIKRTYPYEEVMTPYERLRNVPRAEGYLRPGVTLEKLGTIANQMRDNQSAEMMVNARSKLFQQITGFAKRVA